MTSNVQETHPKIYQFWIEGKRDKYQVVFTIQNGKIESSCSCRYNSGTNLCWHRNYILAGRNNRLGIDEHVRQSELVRLLSQTLEGRELLQRARRSHPEKEACRRCSKETVLDLKKSFTGKLIRPFLASGRRFFCWSCRWSW